MTPAPITKKSTVLTIFSDTTRVSTSCPLRSNHILPETGSNDNLKSTRIALIGIFLTLFKSASLKHNILANIVGSFLTGLMAIAFVPLYIKHMGLEAYGIVGVYASLIGIFAVLDLGLSVSLNRELARLQASGNTDKEKMATTIKTLEVIYWAAAAFICIITISLSHFISLYWLKPEQLSQVSIQNAFFIMAIVLGLRWPVALYTGGLNGLQRQVLVNTLNVTIVTIQNVGALAIIIFVAPTISAFFMWQAFAALVQVLAFRIALKHSVGYSTPGNFDISVLKTIWRFAAGMSGISILATVLMQLDKVILSKTLTLKDFGYYTFAATVAASVFKFVSPIFTAYYPKLVELIERKDEAALAERYHQGCQILSALLLPTAITLAFFSKQILLAWSGDADLVSRSFFLFTLLLIGNTINGLMSIPGAAQTAYGWTALAFYSNLVAVIVLGPAIYFAVQFKGAVGAATVWIILNVGYVTISVFIMHRRILRGEMGRYYLRDLAYPLLTTTCVVGAFRYFAPETMTRIETVLVVLPIFAVTLVAGTLSLKILRVGLLERLGRTTFKPL
jgi:O-antigen/teichoic acid export membrane protein